MEKRMFLAGASGAIGQQIVPILRAEGWHVTGMTRSEKNVPLLRALGAEPVTGDMFDREGLLQLVLECRPSVVMHQVTDLPDGLDPALMAAATARNARIRDEGTRNLVSAAVAAGAKRLVAQSLAFVYAPGTEPYTEEQPLNIDAPGDEAITPRGVASLEQQVLGCGIPAVVLRYGLIYGPGTGFHGPFGRCSLSVHGAAQAAVLAMDERVPAGVYNVVEPGEQVSGEKARRLLGWPA